MARFVRELEENRTLCDDEKLEGRKIKRYTVYFMRTLNAITCVTVASRNRILAHITDFYVIVDLG